MFLKKHISSILLCSFITAITAYSNHSYAKSTKASEAYRSLGVDVYGTNDKESAAILSRYKTLINKFIIAGMPVDGDVFKMKDEVAAEKLHDELKSKLLAEGRYSFVNISPVVYPEEKEIAITIDVVEKKDQLTRNTFDPVPTKEIKDPDGLIQTMQDYQKIGWELLFAHKIKGDGEDCPKYHCIFGFKDPQLAPFKNKFKSISKHENEIINVLRNDKDTEKRAAAAFLIGMLNSPQKIIQDLMPSLHDPESGVRNNALRVIAVTKMKNNEVKVDFNEMLNVINGPTTIDRNKSLFVLVQLLDDPKVLDLINNKETKIILVNLLKLKQPNNHDMAYAVLKKLSQKDYPGNDIKSWTAWAQAES